MSSWQFLYQRKYFEAYVDNYTCKLIAVKEKRPEKQ